MPGYARIGGARGRRICYDCANAREVAALQTATTYAAYMGGIPEGDYRPRSLSTWTGHHLALITWCERRRHNIGGFLYYFRARDVHGAYWYGTSPGPNMYARMRRAKSQGGR